MTTIKSIADTEQAEYGHPVEKQKLSQQTFNQKGENTTQDNKEGSVTRKPRHRKGRKRDCLWSKITSTENILKAIGRTKAKAGKMKSDRLRKRTRKYCENCAPQDIRQELEKRTYKPETFFQVQIPKANGKFRTLNLQSPRDRIIDNMLLEYIEPICESNIFLDCSYAYRKNRSIKNLIRKVMDMQKDGMEFIVKADLHAFFDTIDHGRLLQIIQDKLHPDSQTMHLLSNRIRKTSTRTGYKEPATKITQGIPQGGALSPLLANIYGHCLDQFIYPQAPTYLRYADDILIPSPNTKVAEKNLAILQKAVENNGLKLNMDKTAVTRLAGTNFLGVEFTEYGIRIPDNKLSALWISRNTGKEDDIHKLCRTLAHKLSYYNSIDPGMTSNIDTMERFKKHIIHLDQSSREMLINTWLMMLGTCVATT